MKIAVFNFNGVLDGLVNYLASTGELVASWRDAEVVVMWQDVVSPATEIATDAKNSGKKVYVAEHGLLSINDYIPPLSRKLIGDKLLVWGKETKRWLTEKSTIPEDRIVVTGSTVFDSLKPKRIHEGKNVLFAPRHWNTELPENIRIANELKKLSGVKVFSKIILGEHDPSIYPNPFISQRQAKDHLSITWEALSEADCLVTLGEGTIASLAYYMDIPVVSLDEWEDKGLLGKMYTKQAFFEQVSPACRRVPIGELNSAILDEIEHPEQNRHKRLQFLRDYVDYDSSTPALTKMLNVIYENKGSTQT